MRKIRIVAFVFLLAGLSGCEKDTKNLDSVEFYSFFDETGNWGYLDKNGDVMIEPQWDEAYDFFGGMGIVYQNGKAGMINEEGVVVIPFNYDKIYPFSLELVSVFDPVFRATAINNGFYGFLDENGLEKIPFEYDWAGAFSNGLAPVKIGGKYGYIDADGHLDIPAVYDGFSYFRDGLCWVGTLIDGVMKWGVIDKANNVKLPFEYEGMYGTINTFNAHRFSDGISPYKKNGAFGFLKSDGSTPVDPVYSWTNYFSEGLACVVLDELCGFVNSEFQIVIPIQYQQVSGFLGGFARVRNPSETLWNYINENGDILGSEQYLYADSFNGDLAWVTFQDGKNGYINKSGQTVWKSSVVLPGKGDNHMALDESFAGE